MSKIILATGWAREGFTLIELVALLCLLSLAAAIALPSATCLRRAGEAGAAAREMLLVLNMARWRAVVSGAPTRLVTFARRGDPGIWYIVERQEGTVWIPEGEAHRLPDSVRMRTTGSEIKHFTPRGTSSMGSILLEGAGGGVYRLSFNPATGRVRLYRGDREVGRDG